MKSAPRSLNSFAAFESDPVGLVSQRSPAVMVSDRGNEERLCVLVRLTARWLRGTSSRR